MVKHLFFLVLGFTAVGCGRVEAPHSQTDFFQNSGSSIDRVFIVKRLDDRFCIARPYFDGKKIQTNWLAGPLESGDLRSSFNQASVWGGVDDQLGNLGFLSWLAGVFGERFLKGSLKPKASLLKNAGSIGVAVGAVSIASRSIGRVVRNGQLVERGASGEEFVLDKDKYGLLVRNLSYKKTQYTDSDCTDSEAEVLKILRQSLADVVDPSDQIQR